MPWFRLDDSFHSHPKVIAAGNEAIGLFTRCGTYAAQHLTDGFVPDDVALLYGTAELADQLVRAKLWRRTKGGWRMPDYLEYNPSAEQVKQERKNAAERQRRRRSGTIPVGNRQTPVDNWLGNDDQQQNASSDGTLSRRDSRRDIGVSHTTPTRPDPYSYTGSYLRTGPGYPQAGKPDFSSTQNGAATRQPPPFAEAQERALHPAPTQPGRHARKDTP